METAILAGGCFWGVEHHFSQLKGVKKVTSGYTGGQTENPTYKQVSTGTTGHTEAVEIIFDPQQISYKDILKFFFRLHDPTTKNRQGMDIGTQYRSAIFYKTETQKTIAQKIIQLVEQSGFWKAPVITTLEEAKVFYKAEDSHQNYYSKKHKENLQESICHTLKPNYLC